MKPQAIFLATALLLGTTGIGLPVTAAPYPTDPLLLAAQSKAPQRTYMTPQRDPNQIAIDITDAEFRVYGIMQRSYGNFFILTTNGVQITYNRDTGNVVVVNSMTGTEFYNYIFTEASRPPASTSSARSNAPQSTTLTPIGNGQYSIYIEDGEFSFSGALTRSSGNTYLGEDGRVRVIYDRGAGRIVVINVVTGTEFYNYPYNDGTVGALPGGDVVATGLSSSSSSSTPQSTTITPIPGGKYSIYIEDGEFSFSGALSRSSGNTYIGQDSQVRVIYDRGTSRITVINKVTGTEFYNYIYSTANEGAL